MCWRSLPYVFIATGKVVPWSMSLSGAWRWVDGIARRRVAGLTIAASIWIHPHYLAYFNWASGGPDRVPARLIDSNLDWGQDLVALQKWWRGTIPDQPIGLAYFGQINPSIFEMRGEPFDWFLPPVRPGTTDPLPWATDPSPTLVGPGREADAGLLRGQRDVAVRSALAALRSGAACEVPRSLGAGLERSRRPRTMRSGISAQFEPIKRIGHSIYVYQLSAEDIARGCALMACDRVRPRRVE